MTNSALWHDIPGRIVLSLSIAGLAFPQSAHGSPGTGDKAAAQILFDEGVRLMNQEHDYADACPKFEESQRIDPQFNTQYRLATCLEMAGKTASAWAAWTELADAAASKGAKEKEVYARRRAAKLEQALSKLTVNVTANSPGLHVMRDGLELGRGQWGLAIPVDPGPSRKPVRCA